MPLPAPKKGENKKKFVDRCMGSSVANKEFPDTSQRRAVCESLWSKRDAHANFLDSPPSRRHHGRVEEKDQYSMLIIHAYAGKPVMRVYKGDDHAVIPVVALVEGVMQASNSPRPELVREKEITKTVAAWNGRPVVVDHPEERGVKVSANNPSILESEQIGFVFNSRMTEKKLKCEAWINVEEVTGKATRILKVVDSLKEGEVVEVSTGFFADLEDASGKFEDKQFEGIISNIVPDHLAILSNGKGACSVEDGCGANRTNKSPCENCNCELKHDDRNMDALNAAIVTAFSKDNLSDEDRRGAIQAGLDAKVEGYSFIVAVFDNSVVYATLEGLFRRAFEISGDGSVTLGNDIEPVRPETEFVPVRVNKEKDMDKKALVDGLITNEATKFTEGSREWLMALEEDQLSQLEPVAATPEPDPEPSADEGEGDEPVTAEEYIDDAPPAIQEVLTQGLKLQQEHRAALTKQIETNAQNSFTKEELSAFDIGHLEKLATLSAPKDFSGRGGPRAASVADDAVPAPIEAFPEADAA